MVGKLGKVDVVYAEMGNTYNLCYHMHNSGGAELVRELMEYTQNLVHNIPLLIG